MPQEVPPPSALPEVISLVEIIMFLVNLFRDGIVLEPDLRQFFLDVFCSCDIDFVVDAS